MNALHRRASAPLFLAFLLALAPFWAGCDSGDPVDPQEGLNILNGVSLNRVLGEPTAAEIDAVRAEWAARSPEASGATIVASGAVPDATVYIVSHQMTSGPGAPFTHYGVVRVPDGLTNAPVLVVHHGGDSGLSITSGGGDVTANTSIQAMGAIFPSLFASTIQVFPVYRSETIRAGLAGLAATYASGGSESPWDYDVDDSIALLSAALDLFGTETNADRIAALGYSRGANTALLHQIRDSRIDGVTEYYGPTDFYNSNAELLAAGLVTGNAQVLGLPGATFLRDEVLLPLRSASGGYDENADYARARSEVIRRSASLFKSDLQNVQIHHHTVDPVVPYPFSQAFNARAGTVGGDYEFNTYTNALTNPGLAHSPEGMPDSQGRTEAWLRDVLGISAETVMESAGEPILF